MELYVNDIETERIRKETEDGHEYLVAPVKFIKNMVLHRGYVPKQEIVKATDDWDGIPAVIEHPTNPAGRPVSINADTAGETSIIGQIRNPKTIVNGDAITKGELWYNITKAEELGGDHEKIAANLEQGVSHAVSSAYAGRKLPAGEYDGDEHESVMGNLKPDHVAILVDNTGRCKIEDGCLAGKVAANEVFVNAIPDDPGNSGEGLNMPPAFNALSEARTPDYDGTSSSSWSAPTLTDYVNAYDLDAESVEDLSAQDRSTIASHTLLGDADAESFDDLQVFPVVEPGSRELNENALDAVLSGRGAQADIPESALESARSVATRLLEGEYDRELSSNAYEWIGRKFARAFGLGELITNDPPAESGEPEQTMSNKTQELVDTYGFNAENLPEEDTECFDRIYERFTANEEESEESEAEAESEEAEESEASEEETDESGMEETIELTEDELESRISARVEEVLDSAVDEALAANQEQVEKEQLVDEIIANSDDYDDDDRDELLDSSRVVLEKINEHTPTQGRADHRARRGASRPSAGTESASTMPALSANARIAELEQDGDD